MTIVLKPGKAAIKQSMRNTHKAGQRRKLDTAPDAPTSRPSKEPKGWKTDARLTHFEKQAKARLAGGGVHDRIREVLDLQGKRISRNSKITYENLTDGNLKEIIDAQRRDMSYRSRIAQMIMEVKDSTAFLEDGLSLLRRYLKSEYSTELKATFGAITNQDAAIENHFKEVVASVKSASRFIDIANEAIKDIDQTAFSFQRLLTSASLVLGPRGRTN